MINNNKTIILYDAEENKEKEFNIIHNKKGSCDECYFRGKTCPILAVTICCSNGGNIFKLVEEIK